MNEIHANEATRISKENARLNKSMDEIFKTIKANAKLGMFYADIPYSVVNLNELEQSIIFKRLSNLSYKVTKITTGIRIEWDNQ